MPERVPAALALSALVLALALAGCPGPAGGPVDGGADLHCTQPDGGQVRQATSPSACQALDGGMVAEYGDTRSGTLAADDDCKYDVQLQVTPVRQGQDVSLVVKVTSRTDGAAVAGASTRAELFLGDTHPAPNAGTTTVEAPPGTYTLAPVRFDASGRWTARFHFFEACADDSEESPHGHVAFFLDVP